MYIHQQSLPPGPAGGVSSGFQIHFHAGKGKKRGKGRRGGRWKRSGSGKDIARMKILDMALWIDNISPPLAYLQS